MRLYVGNLSYDMSGDELKEVFGAHGDVREVCVPYDRVSGRPRGFAFVEFGSDDGANTAMEALNGAELGGRTITVNVARARAERDRNGYGGGRDRS